VIIKATVENARLLVAIGESSFIDSHGISAAKKDIDEYVALKFNVKTFTEELQDFNNHFYIIYHNEIPVGYSKIIFNYSNPNIDKKNVAKLERLYLLKEFHHLKLGIELLNFNIEVAKTHNQTGMWLFVWTENTKAFNFYTKVGFKIIGSYDFKLSETHSNPNYQMLLTF